MPVMSHPDPNCLYPISGVTRTCFLKNIITKPQIIVGDYTYYDDPDDVRNFEKNVLYLFDFSTDKLIIGKFCQRMRYAEKHTFHNNKWHLYYVGQGLQ